MTQATAIIAAQSARSDEVLGTTDPTASVPTCPDWSAEDLLWHLTEVQEFWAGNVEGPSLTEADAKRVDASKDPRPTGPEAYSRLLDRHQVATDRLICALSDRLDEEPCWSWFGADQTVGFTRRMQVHEATVHRVDAELTARIPVTPPDPEVVLDGIDHLLHVMYGSGYEWIPEWATTTTLATFDLAAEGNDPAAAELARWSGTRPRDGESFTELVARPQVSDTDAGALPHAIVRGSPADVYLWGWGRPGTVEVDGDAEAVSLVRDLREQGLD